MAGNLGGHGEASHPVGRQLGASTGKPSRLWQAIRRRMTKKSRLQRFTNLVDSHAFSTLV